MSATSTSSTANSARAPMEMECASPKSLGRNGESLTRAKQNAGAANEPPICEERSCQEFPCGFRYAQRRIEVLRCFSAVTSNVGLGSCLKNCRVSAAMKYCQDNNAMLLRTKINAVRKAICDDTSNVLANNGKLERMFSCQRYATVNLRHELKSKAKSLAFIPHTCFDELCTGGTMKSNGQTHCLILARAAAFTSLQGTTSLGFARWSARRRSSSVFCASVNDGAAPC